MLFGRTTLSNARSSDFGSLSVPISRAVSRMRFARSASVSFVFLAGILALLAISGARPWEAFALAAMGSLTSHLGLVAHTLVVNPSPKSI